MFKDLKRMIAKMMNKTKENMYKHLNEFKERNLNTPPTQRKMPHRTLTHLLSIPLVPSSWYRCHLA
jgi:transposase